MIVAIKGAVFIDYEVSLSLPLEVRFFLPLPLSKLSLSLFLLAGGQYYSYLQGSSH